MDGNGAPRDPRTPDGRPPESQPKWRRDFPIDRAQDAYISRRDFTRFLVLTSGAFVAGQLWIAGQSVVDAGAGEAPDAGDTTGSQGAPPLLAIAPLAELPVGAVRKFHYPGDQDPCLLVRLDENRLVAFSQRCTHLACAVQPDLAESRLACPCHHAFFDIESGRPLSGPPRRPLPRIVLEVIDGTVYATGVELRT